jgi:hypothetical protein
MLFNQKAKLMFLSMVVISCTQSGGRFPFFALAQENSIINRSHIVVILELFGSPAFLDEAQLEALQDSAIVAYTNSEKSAQIFGTVEFIREAVAAKILTDESTISSSSFEQFNPSNLQTNSSLTGDDALNTTQPFNLLLLELNTTCDGCALDQSLFTNVTCISGSIFSYTNPLGPLSLISAAPESPVFPAVAWMASVVDILPATLLHFALVVFYFATGGQGWMNQLGFLNSASSHECDGWSREQLYDDSNVGIFSFGVVCYNDRETVATLRLREYHCLFLEAPCVPAI